LIKPWGNEEHLVDAGKGPRAEASTELFRHSSHLEK
jgi:hypothetical protein